MYSKFEQPLHSGLGGLIMLYSQFTGHKCCPYFFILEAIYPVFFSITIIKGRGS